MFRPGRVLALALVTALAIPASASAQAVLLGSPLVNLPNAGLGCEIRPLPLGGLTGMLLPMASGTADCTWFADGVFGVADPAADPRVSTVAGDGTVTKISVRSGPTPAPIRFVVGRSRDGVCCSFVAETEVVQPQPNTVTGFDVNLPVQRSGNVADFVGVSAASNTGSLPLHSTGFHILPDSVFGNPRAGAVYPRLSSASNPGQRPDGNPGFEVSMQVTFCPAGQPCTSGTGIGPVGDAPGGGPGGDAPRDATRPVLRRWTVTPRTFRVASGRTARVARVRAGSKLRFSLSEPATVKVAFERRATGSRSRGRCGKPTSGRHAVKRCVRWVRSAALTRKNVAAGPTAVRFTGRIGNRRLRPGRYRALITPTDAAGNKGAARTAGFEIVR